MDFKEYLYRLLISPLKKVEKSKNQFYIFFKVIGKYFEESKADIVRVQKESMLISASEKILEEYGKERFMPRLVDEDVESYRKRLMFKRNIAETAGEKESIKKVLISLGYEKSFIEPSYKYDPEKWAEFTIYLDGKTQSSVANLELINKEIREVKPASSKVSYGIGKFENIVIATKAYAFQVQYPVCGIMICGEE